MLRTRLTVPAVNDAIAENIERFIVEEDMQVLKTLESKYPSGSPAEFLGQLSGSELVQFVEIQDRAFSLAGLDIDFHTGRVRPLAENGSF